jgi:hypothetical protein
MIVVVNGSLPRGEAPSAGSFPPPSSSASEQLSEFQIKTVRSPKLGKG